MKKTNQKTGRQTSLSSFTIASMFDDPVFVQYMVEQLADRRYDIGYSRESVPSDFKAVETSSIEAYVNGSIIMVSDNNADLNMSFVGCFLFTCTKAKGEIYRLSFVNSLS